MPSIAHTCSRAGVQGPCSGRSDQFGRPGDGCFDSAHYTDRVLACDCKFQSPTPHRQVSDLSIYAHAQRSERRAKELIIAVAVNRT